MRRTKAVLNRPVSLAVLLLLPLMASLGLGTAVHAVTAAPARTAASSQLVVAVTGSLGGMSTSPLSMSPAFSTTTTDYAIWCNTGFNNLNLTLTAAPGTTITVGNQTGAQVTTPIAVLQNQAIVVDTNGQPQSQGFWIRCLPQNFPKLAVTKSPSAPPGYYITGTLLSGGLYLMVLNQNGTPVWYQPAPNDAIDVTLLPNTSTLAWSPNLGIGTDGVGSDPKGGFNTFNLATQTSGVIQPPIEPADPHELQVLPNGDYLMIATPLLSGVNLSSLPSQLQSLRGFTTIVDCVVEEFNPTTHAVDWSWDAYKDGHITPAEDQDGGLTAYNGQNAVDLYHCNSAALSPQGSNMLVSFRYEDAVYDIGVGGSQNKQVLWKLGGDATVPAGAKSLIPTGDPEGTFSGQHDARIMSVIGDQPSEVSLFDDHSFGDAAGSKAGGARGAEYLVNAAAGTAAYSGTEFPPGGHSTDSIATGSFRTPDLPGGTDSLVGWGIQNGGSEFTEFDPGGSVLMDVKFATGEQTYRVEKVPLSALDLNQLRAAVPSPSPPLPGPGSTAGFATHPPAHPRYWAATNSDGRVEVFMRGGDGQFWHDFETTAGNMFSWSGWYPMGGSWPGEPDVVLDSTGQLELFARGGDGQLWHAWEQTKGNSLSWSGFFPMGGAWPRDPVVGKMSNGDLNAYLVGGDGQLWDAFQTNSSNPFAWSGYYPLGGAWPGQPSVAAESDGRLDVFLRGGDGQLWHAYQGKAGDATSLSPFYPLGKGLLGDPVAATNGAGEIEVLMVGGAEELLQLNEMASATSSNWSMLASLGGSWPRDPTLAVGANGNLQAFMIGGDGQLWYMFEFAADSWEGPFPLGGVWPGEPTTVSPGSGNVDVFLVGGDANLWQAAETPAGAWSGFYPLGGAWPTP